MRAVIGTLATLVGFSVDHSLGMAAAAVTGVWVLVGIGTVIGAAADKPTAPVDGALAPAPVRSADDGRPAPPEPRGDGVTECPRCSQFVFPPATICSCGWVVSNGGPEAGPTQ